MSAPLLAPSISAFSLIQVARAFWPRQIVLRLRPLDPPAGPPPKPLFHPLRLDAELRHRNAAVDGFAVFRDQPVAHDETAHAVDHHALARKLRDGGSEA